MRKLVIFIAITSLAASCVVSKKQFDELLAEKVKMEADLLDMQTEILNLSYRKDSLEVALETAGINIENTENELTKTTTDLTNLQAEHDKLQTYYNNALNNSGKMTRDMKEQHERLLAMQETLEATNYNNKKLEDSLLIREAKVAELERIVNESQDAIKDLKGNLSAALLDFGKGDLTIEQKNGKIYVSLSEQLLFKSSSIQVDPKGVKALNQLASVLESTPDIHILIEGHTDNVPIAGKSKYLQDNWDLSVLRATSIVKILVKAGVNPVALTPAGRGENLPVITNDTPEHKAQNRRIEIIITPDLDKLFVILEQTNE
ncbi:OmpA domain protein [hydrothermal vent metagenome]|uniref:OmpA domain protein n=1 Tax=hydrothermal vent metagenome TaxID=652676 RepID=A0A3B0VZ43_9ZZZZ